MSTLKSHANRPLFRKALLLCASAIVFSILPARAADHRDGPTLAYDNAADIADGYVFLDPTDSTKVVMIATTSGFIAPDENVSSGIFDSNVRYRFEIENTGDAQPDLFIDVTFSARNTTAAAQMATVKLPRGIKFTARATNPSLDAVPPTPVVTSTADESVDFFAGEVDDPFFANIAAVTRYLKSRADDQEGHVGDRSLLNRGHDSFAGTNLMAIALRVPVAMIKGSGNIIGVDFLTQRGVQIPRQTGVFKSEGVFRNIDRIGNPLVNATLVPFARKNAFNAATTLYDAKGKFMADIAATLTGLGTNSANMNALAEMVVNHGDFLRLDVTKLNSGAGGGDNDGIGFPNGRRLKDDTVDVMLHVITNGLTDTDPTETGSHGDNVDANDVPLQDTFPFLAPPHQPQ